jgi:hypothetical protein
MTYWRLGLIAAMGLFAAGCSSPSASSRSNGQPPSSSTHPREVTTTTRTPSSVAETAPTSPDCSSGAVTVNANPGGEPTLACVRVGSVIVMTGGNATSGGTWPGPPRISSSQVLKMVSSTNSGTRFTARLRAIRAGFSSVAVPFVPGQEVCNPTPCTPVPGAPLDLEVTVVG